VLSPTRCISLAEIAVAAPQTRPPDDCQALLDRWPTRPRWRTCARGARRRGAAPDVNHGRRTRCRNLRSRAKAGMTYRAWCAAPWRRSRPRRRALPFTPAERSPARIVEGLARDTRSSRAAHADRHQLAVEHGGLACVGPSRRLYLNRMPQRPRPLLTAHQATSLRRAAPDTAAPCLGDSGQPMDQHHRSAAAAAAVVNLRTHSMRGRCVGAA